MVGPVEEAVRKMNVRIILKTPTILLDSGALCLIC